MPVPEGGDPTRVTGRRIVGGLFDGVIDRLFLYTVYGMVGIKLVNGTLGTATPEVIDSKIGIIATAYLAYIVATKVVTLGFFGWTPGMLITGVRCVKYTGRAPGIGRSLVRTLVYQLGSQFGLFWVVLSYLVMSTNKSHRAIQDMAVGTYVIDSIYFGHLLIRDSAGGVMVGPESVTREEAERYLRKQGAAAGFPMPAQSTAKNGEPFLDKNLDTYVVWNEKHSAWLAFDKGTGGWVQIG
jgi:uncharacterized RDD family membrane protein YckC